NAPLAFALQDADRAGRIRLHVRLGERTAGYLAIGLAVAERAPVCVALTSGTAVANLGPAVVEANYARVPRVVLSANRPYDVRGAARSGRRAAPAAGRGRTRRRSRSTSRWTSTSHRTRASSRGTARVCTPISPGCRRSPSRPRRPPRTRCTHSRCD